MSLAACRFPRGRVQSKCIHLLIFKRGNVHCAWDSFIHQTADTPLPSVASPPLHKLDQTGHCHLSHGGDADRSCQKQVRTRGRKRTPAKASQYPAPTHETTCMYHYGPHAPGASGKHGSSLETSPLHRSGRRRYCGGIARVSGSSGSTNPEQLLANQGYPRERRDLHPSSRVLLSGGAVRIF